MIYDATITLSVTLYFDAIRSLASCTRKYELLAVYA